MKKKLPFSIIIPAFNEASGVGRCLEALKNLPIDIAEVIVVDDGSNDGIERVLALYNCRLVSLAKNKGPSIARNEGAIRAKGQYLIFIDADCVLTPSQVTKCARIIEEKGLEVFGGTYEPFPLDEKGLINAFHAAYVSFFESRKPVADYLAAHFLVIEKKLFLKMGGFRKNKVFGKVSGLEDIEFSRRLVQTGVELYMRGDLKISHRFELTPFRAFITFFKRSYIWTRFAFLNSELSRDSGTASKSSKATFILSFLLWMSLIGGLVHPYVLSLSVAVAGINFYVNRQFFKFLIDLRGRCFLLKILPYYWGQFSLAAILGFCSGILSLNFKLIFNRYRLDYV